MSSLKTRGKAKKIISDILYFIAGSFVFGVGTEALNAPNHIAPGGLTGISTVINYLCPVLSIGTMFFVLNIPLFLLGYKRAGKEFIIRSFIGSLSTSVAIDVIKYVGFPVYKGNTLLAAIYGGLFIGVGMSLIFMAGGTTGGSDIVAILLAKKFKHISMSRFLLIVDCIVITVAALIYRELEAALYSAIALFVSTKVIDVALYGLDKNKLLFIVTDKKEELSEAITTQLTRGMTILNGTGAYTGTHKNVIMCAVRRNEVYKARDIVGKCDPGAFMIVGDVDQIMGEGFYDDSKIMEYMK
ncbi:MAG: YitT family protein [Clostridia bacterium]|nr:YitT family protein [Clostridia bacterium]